MPTGRRFPPGTTPCVALRPENSVAGQAALTPAGVHRDAARKRRCAIIRPPEGRMLPGGRVVTGPAGAGLSLP